jgi:leucine dehydrogenase
MTVDALAEFDEHELLHLFHDAETGVRGAVAIHSTALGPAMGGLRLHAYATTSDAVTDALRLARAMSLKNAAAGLDLGGGKAVLIDDGNWHDRSRRMRAVGLIVDDLEGRYITAEDVGTTPDDMDDIAQMTSHVAGRPVDRGGRGDPSPSTARTVFGAIKSAALLQLDTADLAGVHVGVQGAGNVGSRLVELLVDAGARVSVTDVVPARAHDVAARLGATPRPIDGFILGDYDILAPCALGGAITAPDVARLTCVAIAGAANNPLASPDLADALHQREILYVPDFLANCGGIIHVGAEVLDIDETEVEARITSSIERTAALLHDARERGIAPLEVAVDQARRRLREGSVVDRT